MNYPVSAPKIPEPKTNPSLRLGKWYRCIHSIESKFTEGKAYLCITTSADYKLRLIGNNYYGVTQAYAFAVAEFEEM